MDQTCIDTTDSFLGDSSNSYLNYGSQRNSKTKQPSFFTFEPIPPNSSGGQHLTASSLSGSNDPLCLRMDPDLSIDPHYHPDFRRNPRLNDFGLGEVHSPFNDFSVYDDGLFSGESYRPSFLNRPFFSRGFASSPSFSEPVGGCQDMECALHDSSVPTTPTLLSLCSQRSSVAIGNASLASGSSQLGSTTSQLTSANSQLTSTNSQLGLATSQLASTNSQLTSSNSQLASGGTPQRSLTSPQRGSSVPPQRTSPPAPTQRTSPQRSVQRTQRHGISRASQSSPQRPGGRYSGNRSRTGSPGTVDVSNEVRLEDVESGKDKRTTLMIKNIPNAFE